MKRNSLFILSNFIGMLLIFSSCQKNLEAGKADEVMGTPLPSTTTYCRVDYIVTHGPGSDGTPWFVVYDEFENPTAMITINVGFGRPNHFFKYDHWHRMIEYRQEVHNGLFQEWHFYGFDLNGRIAYDSVYFMGQISDPRNAPFVRYNTLEYDNKGRIIREGQRSYIDNFASIFWIDYLYGAQGNLMSPSAVYDDKVNLNRTNDIWQFLLRDYSMNNRFIAISYNTSGYPVDLPNFGWVTGGFTDAQVGYSCRPSHYF